MRYQASSYPLGGDLLHLASSTARSYTHQSINPFKTWNALPRYMHRSRLLHTFHVLLYFTYILRAKYQQQTNITHHHRHHDPMPSWKHLLTTSLAVDPPYRASPSEYHPRHRHHRRPRYCSFHAPVHWQHLPDRTWPWPALADPSLNSPQTPVDAPWRSPALVATPRWPCGSLGPIN